MRVQSLGRWWGCSGATLGVAGGWGAFSIAGLTCYTVVGPEAAFQEALSCPPGVSFYKGSVVSDIVRRPGRS